MQIKTAIRTYLPIVGQLLFNMLTTELRSTMRPADRYTQHARGRGPASTPKYIAMLCVVV